VSLVPLHFAFSTNVVVAVFNCTNGLESCRLGRSGLVRIGENLKSGTLVQFDCCSVASINFEKDECGLGIGRRRGGGLERCGSVWMGMAERSNNETNGLLDDLVADTIASPFGPDPKSDNEP